MQILKKVITLNQKSFDYLLGKSAYLYLSSCFWGCVFFYTMPVRSFVLIESVFDIRCKRLFASSLITFSSAKCSLQRFFDREYASLAVLHFDKLLLFLLLGKLF